MQESGWKKLDSTIVTIGVQSGNFLQTAKATKKTAMAAVLMCKKVTPIWVLKWMRVYCHSIFRFIFKLRTNYLPKYLMEMVTFNQGYAGNARAWNSVFHKGLLLLNSITKDVKDKSNENSFKENFMQVKGTTVDVCTFLFLSFYLCDMWGGWLQNELLS